MEQSDGVQQERCRVRFGVVLAGNRGEYRLRAISDQRQLATAGWRHSQSRPVERRYQLQPERRGIRFRLWIILASSGSEYRFAANCDEHELAAPRSSGGSGDTGRLVHTWRRPERHSELADGEQAARNSVVARRRECPTVGQHPHYVRRRVDLPSRVSSRRRSER